jgi:hypothetical protein
MMFQFPSSIRSVVLLDCAFDLSQASSGDYLHRAKDYAQRALRMVLLMRGREDSASHCCAHEVVLKVLKQQPLQAAPPTPNECALCGESPELVGIKHYIACKLFIEFYNSAVDSIVVTYKISRNEDIFLI